MLLIEFQINIICGLNLLKYKNIDEDIWYYLYVDIETLNLLISNFGIFATRRIPTAEYTYTDNSYTSKKINVQYCGAQIEFYCGNDMSMSVDLLNK